MGHRAARRIRRMFQSEPIQDCAVRNARPDAKTDGDVDAEGYVAALLERACPLKARSGPAPRTGGAG